MQNSFIPALIGVALFTATAQADADANAAIDQLANTSVSRLEWGLEKFKRALIDTFAIDPLTLETSSPPFFINVFYENDDGRILVEIGRTFPSLNEGRADELCREYIGRVRGLVSVDRSGRPSVKDASSLAIDFFHPAKSDAEPELAFAQALDATVMLRALVASPINGVFAICTASLTGSPVRFVK